jgi:hypothetical protein
MQEFVSLVLAWFKGGTPPGFWTTTASVLLQVIEMKGDAKDTPVDQGVDHVDHPWPSPKQSVWRPLHSGEAIATSPVRISHHPFLSRVHHS